MQWVTRIITWAIAAGIGAVYGAAGTIMHSWLLGVVPAGLVLALVGTVALTLALRLLFPQRAIAIAAGIGLVGMVFVLSGRSAGGSVFVADNLLGLIWVWAGALSVLAILLWPQKSDTARSPAN